MDIFVDSKFFFFRNYSWVLFSGFLEVYNEVFFSEVEKYVELVGGNYI